MIFDVFHWTEYRYRSQVPISQHLLHMKPRALPWQRVLSSRFEFVPKPSSFSERLDYFGNEVTDFHIGESHIGLHIKCLSRVEITPRKTPPPAETVPWEKAAAHLLTLADADPRAFLYPSPYAPRLVILREWAEASFPPGRPILEGALDLAGRIHREFAFDKAATDVGTPLGEMFASRRGVCQDFAHLQIACLRSLGLAARYVSGYLRTEPPPGQPRLFGADASHAWVALYCPGHGWIEIDPTNHRLITEDYVTIGWGRDYSDVSLIRGSLTGGGSHSIYLSVNVEPVEQADSPTKPPPKG